MPNDPNSFDADDDAPDLLISPAVRDSSRETTIVFYAGPPDPPEQRSPELRDANRLLRLGMAALENRNNRDYARAERCFRDALELVVPILGAQSQKASYVFDRLGLVAHLQKRHVEAELWYDRSLLYLSEPECDVTPWNLITLMNLGHLYRTLGRHAEARACAATYTTFDSRAHWPRVP